ncbi:DUF3408 domain-containing protein [Niabella defluvii]|nr:DUF3408 domain-containing protein [Niabella sp. I65]
MQKDNQKPNRPVVDEKYMMSIMAGEAKEQATPQQESAQDPVDNPVQKPEKTKQRKSQEPDYEKTFSKELILMPGTESRFIYNRNSMKD